MAPVLVEPWRLRQATQLTEAARLTSQLAARSAEHLVTFPLLQEMQQLARLVQSLWVLEVATAERQALCLYRRAMACPRQVSVVLLPCRAAAVQLVVR
jgi:hypothetical protein